MKKYAYFIPPVADTYAFCLLKNHFHLLIRTHTEAELKKAFPDTWYQAEKFIILRIAHFFNAYAQAINKVYQRTGALFESPFRRIEIQDEHHFRNLITYIHANPQKHGFVTDFRQYPWSSYSIMADSCGETWLQREAVYRWYNGREQFTQVHNAIARDITGLPMEELFLA